MSIPSCLIIRADAGGLLGSGHVMRMIALAQAYSSMGGRVRFVMSICPEGLRERLRAEGFEQTIIEGLDVEATIAEAHSSNARWVVIDGYQFDSEYHQGIRAGGLKVMAFDDFGHCPVWFCDALVDLNLGSEDRPHGHFPLSSTKLFFGSRYALLRSELLMEELPPRHDPMRRILVSLGGVDPENATSAVLLALEKWSRPDLEIRVIVGAGNPHRKRLFEQFESDRIKVIGPVSDMETQYTWADGIVSAGGGTVWEWLYFGLAGAVVTIAENQKFVVEELSKRGLGVSLGWVGRAEWEKAPGLLADWLKSPPDLPELPPVDGLGAQRIARFLRHGVILRRASIGDSQQYFEWVNAPEVRGNAVNRNPIQPEEHQKWFAGKITSDDTLLLVGEVDQKPVGQIRFEERSDGRWEVDISIESSQQGRGFGGILLEEGLDELRWQRGEGVQIFAQVRKDNGASLSLFQKAGFHHFSSSDELEEYSLKL